MTAKAHQKSVDDFLIMVSEHDKRVRNLVYAIVHDGAVVDDLAQETYLRAFKAFDSFRHDASMKTWICRIATNVALDHTRKRRVVVPLTPEDEPRASDVDHYASRLDIFDAFGRLSAEHRAAVLLVDLEEFDYATAAEMCGIPQGTLASRVNAARKQLRQLLVISDGSEQA